MTTPAVPPTEPNDGPERETLPPPDSFDQIVNGGDNTPVADDNSSMYHSGMTTVSDVRAMRHRQPPADLMAAARARIRTRLTGGPSRVAPAPDDWPDDIHADPAAAAAVLAAHRDD